MKRFDCAFPVVEILEARIAPAVHTWTGAGTNNLWSNDDNWTGGSPASDVSNIDLVFPTNADRLVMQNDIEVLVVDSITFDASGGTSKNGYTINGNGIIIATGAAGQDPFGIDVLAGVADPDDGITQTFNINLSLLASDATFRTAEAKSRLVLHGNISLGTRTLTLDCPAAPSGAIGIAIDGDISSGDLIKINTGTLQLSGDNSFTDLTVNGGMLRAERNTALGATAGVVAVNDPGRVELRHGITVVKSTLNLNSNALGGGLGADGNTENTFRGSVVLMAGAGGVALGAGNGAANANTRLIIDGVISGATSTLSLNGSGVIEFTQNNTYSGITNQNGNQGFGALQIDQPGGLGASGEPNRTLLNRNGPGPTGSALWLNFSGSFSEPIHFAGSGVNGLGAIRVLGDHQITHSGNITFIAGAPWVFGVDAGSLTTTGLIDDQGVNRALTKAGAGTLFIAGASDNTYSGGTIVNGGTLSVQNTSGNALGDDPTLGALNLATVNGGATLRVEGGVSILNTVVLNPGGTLTGAGTVATLASNGGIISPGLGVGSLFSTGNVTFDDNSTFLIDINGPSIGVTNDNLFTLGSVNLGGAQLVLSGNFSGAPGSSTGILGAVGALTGTFAGLPDGARVAGAGQIFTIDYTVNSVFLTAVTPLSDVTVAANGRAATFTDADGDLVTVKITKGTLSAADFTFGFTADNRQQLRQLHLDAADAGTNLTITAKRTALGGDGRANVGYVSAVDVPLGAVSIDGDLGRIDATAVKSLTVQSLGAFGIATQAPNGSLVSRFSGNLGKLTVKASIHGASLLSAGSIGTVKVLDSFLGGQLSAGADLGAVSVRGDVIGTGLDPVIISAFGKAVAPAAGKDLALKSLSVAGGVEGLRVLAGYDLALTGRNADASIGPITVGADWRASTVLAGVTAGIDGYAGTIDDAKISIAGARDTATIFSSIAGVTIKGQAFGTTEAGDAFGIVAELITRAKAGKVAFKLDKGERDAVDAFPLASTGPGATALPSDFFLREATL